MKKPKNTKRNRLIAKAVKKAFKEYKKTFEALSKE